MCGENSEAARSAQRSTRYFTNTAMPIARTTPITTMIATLRSMSDLGARSAGRRKSLSRYSPSEIGKPRYRPVPLGGRSVLKTRAVPAALFSSVTGVPAGADQASPALYTFRSAPILYVTSPAMMMPAVKPTEARCVRQPGRGRRSAARSPFRRPAPAEETSPRARSSARTGNPARPWFEARPPAAGNW